MRRLRFATFSCMVGLCATSAFAQYGLYGSPDMLRMPDANAAAVSSNAGYSESVGRPGIAVSATQTVPPAQGYYQPYYPSRTQAQLQPQSGNRYPAQGSAVAMYQPAPTPVNPPMDQPLPPQPPEAMPAQNPTAVNPLDCYGGSTSCGAACRGDACGEALGSCRECPWYASLSTIVLGRGEGRRLWTSFADGVNTDQLTNTQDIGMPWAWGGEVRLGRRFCCGCDPWAIEGTFWTTAPMDGYHSTTNPNPNYLVSTPLELLDLEYGGAAAQLWFDGAEEHRLWRHDEFYNVEINLIRQQISCGCDSPWNIGWLAGIRYFRFDESLTFGSLRNGGSWGDLDQEAYLDDNITNNLIGCQIGADMAYRFGGNWRFFISPKIGIYNNNMNQYFQAYLGDGTVASTPYGDFPTRGTRNDIAFLSQVDLGVDWQFACNWSARVGYRLIAATGVAQADDQFPQYIVDIPEIQHIDNHSSLVLHGAFAGLTYNF